MRVCLFLLFYFVFYTSGYTQSGTKHEFGKPFQKEIEMEIYEEDPSADAVYLYERGDVYFKGIENRIWIVKEYYAKIKVFNSSNYEGKIVVPYRVGNNIGERVEDLEAITHTNGISSKVSNKDVFSSHYSGRWHMKTFAFPNLQDGSIVEYRYKLLSPYHFSLENWEFQSEYPKVFSEIVAKINSNYFYRKTLIGNLKLDVENSKWQKNCVYIEGVSKPDCEIIHLGMKDIPAFIEEEFMLSKKNYASKVSFDLMHYIDLYGKKTNYSYPWEYIDKNFEKVNVIHKQLNHQRYFRNKLPSETTSIQDPLEKAKKVFAFFQDHFTWDDYLFRIDQDIELKTAFKNKTGSVDEINLSLLNSLLGLGYKAHFMLLSTRNRQLPSDIHPNFYDYNYLVVRLEIDDKVYLLDAADPYAAFGALPFRALNRYGRVFNYNGKSFWQDIRVLQNSSHQINILANLDTDGNLQGKVNERFTNYLARHKRSDMSDKKIENLTAVKEKSFNNNTIENLSIHNQDDNNAALVERFEVQAKSIVVDDKIMINPFLNTFFPKNPLTLNERSYPLNFGYPRSYVYQITIELTDDLEVLEVPENHTFSSSDNTSDLQFSIETKDGKIDLIYIMNIYGDEYLPEAYPEIKDLFSQSVDIQNNSLIVLKKL